MESICQDVTTAGVGKEITQIVLLSILLPCLGTLMPGGPL